MTVWGRRVTAVLGSVLALIVLASSGLLGPRYSVMVDDIAQTVGGATAAVTCWWTARHRSGAERHWRVLMGTGMAGWTVGMVFWATYRSVLDQPLPSPSWADIGFFVFPVMAIPALFAMVGQPVRRQSAGAMHVWWAAVLDGLVVVGSLFMISWSTALGAVAHTDETSQFRFLVAVMYPITDLVVIGLAALLIMNHTVLARYRTQLVLLAAGVVMLALSDSLYAYLVAAGADSMPPITDFGFVAGPPLIALAAAMPPVATHREPAVGGWSSQRTRLLLPYLLILIISAIVGVRYAFEGTVDPVIMVLGIAVFTVAIVRQMSTLLENDALLRRVSATQEELTYRAHHDALTGLFNRASLEERVTAAIADYPRTADTVLMLIDLDDFKTINDLYGHGTGDRSLVIISDRLRAAVGPDVHVSRYGGDEFTVLVHGRPDVITEIAARVVDDVSTTFDVDGHRLSVGASVGWVGLSDVHPTLTVDSVLHCADRAMYEAKRAGKGGVVRALPDGSLVRVVPERHDNRGTSPNTVAGEPDPARLMVPPTRT